MDLTGKHMSTNVHDKVVAELFEKFNNEQLSVMIPPPVFNLMRGKVINYDKEAGLMEVEFPVAHQYLNPFGSMQGGMIAAAVDNTFGPLSMLVGPLNYTRQSEIKYRKLIEPNIKTFIVKAKFEKRNKRQLFFSASVIDTDNNELASAKAIHWIVRE